MTARAGGERPEPQACPDDSGAVYVPLDELARPKEGYCVVNRWWSVHPDRGAIFYHPDRKTWSPQCNSSEHTSRFLTSRLWPGCETTFIPVAFLGDKVSEYD